MGAVTDPQNKLGPVQHNMRVLAQHQMLVIERLLARKKSLRENFGGAGGNRTDDGAHTAQVSDSTIAQKPQKS